MNTEETFDHAEKDLTDDQVKNLQENLKESQEKYVRLLAESENARKRMQKEKQESTKYAIESLIAEFLQPIDSFEKALKFAENSSDEVKHWAVGFEMILTQFKQVLSTHGVEEFDSLGKHYDPHFHEALEVVHTKDHPSDTVIFEFAKGYKVGDRVIRVARVKVAKAQTPESASKEKTE